MPATDELIDASAEGRAARRAGAGRDTCPHPEGIAERRYWLMGWDMEERRQTLHPVFADILNKSPIFNNGRAAE